MTSHRAKPQQISKEIDTKSWLRRQAIALGFADCGFADPASISNAGDRLAEFVAAGFHGDMTWLLDTAEKRADPTRLWPEVKTIIVLTWNYGPTDNPLKDHHTAQRGIISCYAKGKDYHEIVKPKLIALARELDKRTGTKSRVFVDTAPLMEKPLAAAAGLGWQGKHTNLVSRNEGSWTFLGAILSSANLDADPPGKNHCGSCHRCLDVCPTNAFPAPYRLDATRCIAYLTIEHKGHIPVQLRKPIGNRIFGCDDCLAVCPWNHFARKAEDIRLHPRVGSTNPPLAELLTLDDESFRSRFQGTPIKRTGRNRFLRNVLIAAGNSQDRSLLTLVENHLVDPSSIVRATAVWAIHQLTTVEEFSVLRDKHVSNEKDPQVVTEWNLSAH